MTATRKGGRRKGDSGRRNGGLLKRCGCNRKRWASVYILVVQPCHGRNKLPLQREQARGPQAENATE